MSTGFLCMGCLGMNGGRTCHDCGYHEGTPRESPLQLAAHTVLAGRYELGRVIGQGGFGITYLAHDLTERSKEVQKLAIKEYFPTAVAVRTGDGTTVSHSDPSTQAAFKDGLHKFALESRTLMHLRKKNHPNIVEFLNFFQGNGTGYIVMKYVDGITLLQYLERQGGKIPFQMALNILVPVMDALRAVHGEKIWHRDVSPDNIYITRSGVVKILDFGSTRHVVANQARSQQVFLKPGYSPEEQYRSNGNQGPWTDVYALGATCYRCMTGRVPPPSLDRMAEDELIPPSRLGVLIGERSEAALLRALAVKAAGRFQTISEFQRAITPTGYDAPLSTPREPSPQPAPPQPLPSRQACISKSASLSAFGIPAGFTGLFLLQNSFAGPVDNSALGAAGVCLFATFIAVLFFVHRIWASIQDGRARMSAARAVGFFFIPLVNFLWPLQVIGGFAKDYNNHIARHGIRTRALPESLFMAFSFLWVLFGFLWVARGLGFLLFLPCFVVGLVVVVRACDAVNSLAGIGSRRPGPKWPVIYCVSGELAGHSVAIDGGGLVIGRNPGRAQLVLSDNQVSNTHVRLWSDGSGVGVWLEDQSRHGTYYLPPSTGVAGARWTRVPGRMLLAPRSRFRLGEKGAEFEVRQP